MTSHEFRFSSVKIQATSLIHQTSDVIVDRTVFKSLSPSAIGIAPSKSLVSDQIANNFLSKLEIVITSKTVSPSSSTIKPNIKDEMNKNLEKAVERSSGLSIDSKLLMDLVEQLERHVDEKNESDDMTTKVFQNLSIFYFNNVLFLRVINHLTITYLGVEMSCCQH